MNSKGIFFVIFSNKKIGKLRTDYFRREKDIWLKMEIKLNLV
jgi:hypothetical protein